MNGHYALVVVLLVLFITTGVNAHPAESKFFETSDGAKIHYLEAGSGQVILFVPGILVPAEAWQLQIEHFAKNYRVIAMDPRSQGRSEKVTDGHHLKRRGEDIGELAAHVSKDPVVVVSWSLGVLETLSYIKNHGPGRFRALVLVDMYIGVDAKKSEPHPFGDGWSGWIEGLQTNKTEWAREWLRSFFPSDPPDEFIEEMADSVVKTPTNTAVTLLSNLMHFDERDHRPVVDDTDLPLMLVMSSSSWAVAVAEESRSRWPEKVRVEVIPETGHFLFFEKPRKFNGLLEDFLSGLNKRP